MPSGGLSCTDEAVFGRTDAACQGRLKDLVQVIGASLGCLDGLVLSIRLTA